MFYLTNINKTRRHCHFWLAGQYYTNGIRRKSFDVMQHIPFESLLLLLPAENERNWSCGTGYDG